ncbi:MAG: lytic transglycosylase domain-containing protein [Acidobacteriota bacterium]
MFRKILIALVVLIVIAIAVAFSLFYYRTHRYDKLIAEISPKYQLEPELVKAVIYEESFFDAEARSSQNAIGLMQVTSIAVQEWIDSTHSRNLSDALSNITDQYKNQRDPQLEKALINPQINMHIGCWYLQNLLNRYRNKSATLAVALAAYNAGPSNVDRWANDAELTKLSQTDFIERIEFPVTRNYVKKIIERYSNYKQAKAFK